MPATFAENYARWLTQHGDPREQGVIVLEFHHTAIGSLYVSDYGEPFTFRKSPLEAVLTAVPLGFTVSHTTDNLSTEQRINITLDNANGAVMNEVRTLDLDDLQDPLTVTVYAYLASQRNQPAHDPLLLYVTNITGTRLVAEAEATSSAMPNSTSGTRYTLDQFPTMAYL